ncbi:ATP-binding protein [Allomuricauda sp. d1]|uniref:ATP-binding protein n=1 Tax=Allomuricauda sp. d1 TaxID=3136725 RepID=UPI0031D1331A
MGRLLPILIFLIALSSFSQSKQDSLKAVLANASRDSVRVRTLHKLFKEYQKNSLEKAEETILQAIKLSENTNENLLLAQSYNLYGSFLRVQSREDSAIKVLKKSLEISRDQNFNKQHSDALVTLGHSYWQKGDFEKAKEYQRMNIEFARSIGDSIQVASSYIGLGAIISQQGEYTQAMKYYTMASDIFLQSNHLYGYRVAVGNIGYIQRSLENYDSAIEYLKKSDSISHILDDAMGKASATYDLSVAFRHKGMLDSAMTYILNAIDMYNELGIKKRVSYGYFSKAEIHRKKEDFKAALKDYQTSLGLSISVDDSVQIGYSSMAVADMHEALGNDEQSITYLENAAKVAQRMKLDILAMDVHDRLAERHAKNGDMAKAYENLQKFVVLKDSLYTKEKRELGSEIEAKYQNEQKTKEIELLASEKELQTLQLNKRENERNAIIAFAILVLLLAGLLYNQYRIKQKSNKELKELDQLKSNFFANISHEFRTPLTLIKGPIEHLEQNPDEKLAREDIKMIRRNANKVLGLVNQLLDLSRIDQGKLQLKTTEGDVFKCLSAAAASFNSHAAQRNMDYRVEIPNEVLWASFDRDKLEKVVYNLLSNAFKFCEDGELVSFETSFIDGELQIQVSDSGRGISEEKLPFIFDRFYQVDSSATKDREGSGIGLSLSKDLIELMDGTITVSSEEGKGTYFTVQIPIEKIETRQRRQKKIETPVDKDAPKPVPFDLAKPDKRNLPRIVLVEDNEDMRQFIRGHLLKEYRVQEAINGQDGLKKTMANPPDLVITDLMMPKMDGIDLCKQLKTKVETSHIPIIMLTARAGVENRIEGLETGADDYLTKPFEAKELLVRTKNLIEQRRKLRELFSKSKTTVDPKEIAVNSIDQRFLEQVLDLLEKEHSNPNFGVAQMQKELAMSKTQLHRKIKALTDETPSELLRNFRLKRAAQLLSQKADTVTQIAYQVGFNNLSYFAKCFKELYGVSPSSY